jgi:H+/Cl- antiporter ClcA
MGALFVAVVRAPVTGIAPVVEMTGATALFIPLLAASAAALAVPAALGEHRSTTRSEPAMPGVARRPPRASRARAPDRRPA